MDTLTILTVPASIADWLSIAAQEILTEILIKYLTTIPFLHTIV